MTSRRRVDRPRSFYFVIVGKCWPTLIGRSVVWEAGRIPSDLSSLEALEELFLHDNHLEGECLPHTSFTAGLCSLHELQTRQGSYVLCLPWSYIGVGISFATEHNRDPSRFCRKQPDCF